MAELPRIELVYYLYAYMLKIPGGATHFKFWVAAIAEKIIFWVPKYPFWVFFDKLSIPFPKGGGTPDNADMC